MLGVLGGMGPLATADFFHKILLATPADCDEDHVPLLIASDPRIPRRTPAILGGGTSPLPALRAIRDRLLGAGATMLAMPCNTSHYWYDDLSRDCPVPFISIVEAGVAELALLAKPGDRIGMIGTSATLAGRVFDARLAAAGFAPLLPSEDTLDRSILPAIMSAKVGRTQSAGEMLAPVVTDLLGRGAAAVLLACTEVPVALDAIDSPVRAYCVDTTAALARACVSAWRAGPGAPVEA
jgi:aspartate racemase